MNGLSIVKWFCCALGPIGLVPSNVPFISPPPSAAPTFHTRSVRRCSSSSKVKKQQRSTAQNSKHPTIPTMILTKRLTFTLSSMTKCPNMSTVHPWNYHENLRGQATLPPSSKCTSPLLGVLLEKFMMDSKRSWTPILWLQTDQIYCDPSMLILNSRLKSNITNIVTHAYQLCACCIILAAIFFSNV